MHSSKQRDKREDYERKAEQYLKAIGDRYVFHKASGLYRTEAADAGNKSHEKQPGYDSRVPLWTAVKTDWFVVGISAATLLLLLATVILAHRQWKAIDKQYPMITKSADAAEKAAEVSKDALVSVQRAFVYPVIDISPVSYDPSDANGIPPMIIIQVDWQNAGSTPTKNLAIQSEDNSAEISEESAAEYGGHWPSAWLKKKKSKPIRTYIGPKGHIGWTFDLPSNLLKDIFDGKVKPYEFSGAATYNDIFEGTPPHTTKYCYKLSALMTYSAFPKPKNIYNPRLSQCTVGNCTDDECKAQ